LHNADSTLCIYSLTAMAFFGSAKDLSILCSASSSLANFFGGGAFLKPAIHFSTSALAEPSSSASVFLYDRGAQSLLNGDEIDFFLHHLSSIRL
jgi:hypothetical protein